MTYLGRSLVVLFLFFSSLSVAQAYYLDSPHNESNGIYCYMCHNNSAWYWGDPNNGTGDIDVTPSNHICLSCHGDNPDLGDPWVREAPVKSLHASSTTSNTYGTWSNECTECHDPHSQPQIEWANTDPVTFWLAEGFFDYTFGESPTFNVGDPEGQGFGATTIGISFVTGQAGWTDPLTWNSKGGKIDVTSAVDNSRGLILIPNKGAPTETFEIINAVDLGSGNYQLKIKGQMTSAQEFVTFGVFYGQSIRTAIWDTLPVKFFSPEPYPDTYGGPADLSPDNYSPQGICQVCHATTYYWNSFLPGPQLPPHNSDTSCFNCHRSVDGFAPSAHAFNFFADTPACGTCHVDHLVTPDSSHASCDHCHVPSGVPAINTNVTLTAEAVSPNDALLAAGYYFDGGDGRLRDAGGNAIGDPAFTKITCGTCHTVNANTFYDHTSNTHNRVIATSDGTCETCHVALLSPFYLVAGVYDPPGITVPAPGEVHSPIMCFHCHDSGSTGVFIGSAVNHTIGTDSDCKTCHIDRVSGHDAAHDNTAYEDNPSQETNLAAAGNCANCHAGMGFPDITAGHVGRLISAGTIHGGANIGQTIDCATCHGSSVPAVANTIANSKGASPSNVPASCADCHGPHGNIDHRINVAPEVNCSGCHPDTAAYDVNGPPVTLFDDKVHDDCYTCHDSAGSMTLSSLVVPLMPKIGGFAPDDGGGRCSDCHGTYFARHSSIDHTILVADSSMCNNCHTDIVGLPAGAQIDPLDNKVHDECLTCHDLNGDLVGSSTRAPLMPVVGGPATNDGGGACEICHGTFFPNHIIDHSLYVGGDAVCVSCHVSTAGRVDGISLSSSDNLLHDNCSTCHDVDGQLKGPYGLVADMPQNGGFCLVCHGSAPAGHATGGAHDHRVITGLTDDCTACHAVATQDQIDTLHGTCERCHDYSGSKIDPVLVAGVISSGLGAGGSDQNCESCHGDPEPHHDQAVINHQGCLKCHFSRVVDEHIGNRGYTCYLCHTDPMPNGVANPVINNAIINGRADNIQSCDVCHNDASINPDGTLQNTHHNTARALAGDCLGCHPVGRGMNAPMQPPCGTCHGAGQVFDPQRPSVNAHDNGPAIGALDDFRVCFSCHLEGGSGHYPDPNGLAIDHPSYAGTPVVKPFHSINYPYPQFMEEDESVDSEAEALTWPGIESVRYFFHRMMLKGNADRPFGNYARKHTSRSAKFSTPTIPYNKVSVILEGEEFNVPSYDGTGTGRPAGGFGDLQVTISPAAVLAAGAKWRTPSGSWQESGNVVPALLPRDYQVEGRAVAGWASPPEQQIVVADGILATTTITYEPCGADTTLAVTRTSGGGGTTFNWIDPAQTETFTATGWSPTWDVEWLLDDGGAGGLDLVVVGPNDVRLEKIGASIEGSYPMTMTAIGSNCPGNLVSLPITVNVNAAGAPSPLNNPVLPVIGDQEIDGITLSTSGPLTHTPLIHVIDDIYAMLYTEGTENKRGYIYTFRMSANGSVEKIDTLVLAGSLAYFSNNLAKISDSVYLYTHNDNIKTIGIQPDGTITGPIQNLGFVFTYYGDYNTPIILPQGNGNIAIAYIDGTGIYMKANIATFAVSTDGAAITPIDSQGFDIKRIISDFEYISGDIFALTYKDQTNNQIFIATVNISSDGTINPDFIDTEVVDSPTTIQSKDLYLDHITGDLYTATFNGLDGSPVIKTYSIEADGNIGDQPLSSLNVDTYRSYYDMRGHGVLALGNGVLAVYHQDYQLPNLEKTVVEIYGIDGEGRIGPTPYDTFITDGIDSSLKLIPISGDIYAISSYRAIRTLCIYDPLTGDDDGDGLCDQADTCPNDPAPDDDLDGVCGVVDTCPNDPDNDIDTDGICGDIDNCPADNNPLQEDGDGDGIGDACDNCVGDGIDGDSDGICDPVDICLDDPANIDTDTDGFCDPVDNCPDDINADQLDEDIDGLGDACDTCPKDPLNDFDGDGRCVGTELWAGQEDDCPFDYNVLLTSAHYTDTDYDGMGDVCDPCPWDSDNDIDGDGVCDYNLNLSRWSWNATKERDNCADIPNPTQTDADGDHVGDDCDLCPSVYSYSPSPAQTPQLDTDGDGIGNQCDTCPNDPTNDGDGDGICEDIDNCPGLANPDQADYDGDGIGNLCDTCMADPLFDLDGDGVCTGDNCPYTRNPGQEDGDSNGIGDACDAWAVTQIGSNARDEGTAVTADQAGNVYHGGHTSSSLFELNPGEGTKYELFLAKYDAGGSALYTHPTEPLYNGGYQWGSPSISTYHYENFTDMVTAADGTLWIFGDTQGDLYGVNKGGYDIYLSHWDTSGSSPALLWSDQIGTSGQEYARQMHIAENGHLYLTGQTGGIMAGEQNGSGYDCFIIHLDGAGNLLNTWQFGSVNVDCRDITTDNSGAIYLTGITTGSLYATHDGGQWQDYFVARYVPVGNELVIDWAEQLDGGIQHADEGENLALGPDNSLYVFGDSNGQLPGSDLPNQGPAYDGSSTDRSDAFLRKYDRSSGSLTWHRQIGTVKNDWANGLAVSSTGFIYLGGSSNGSFAGANHGNYDMYLMKYDSAGNRLRTEELGTTSYDVLKDLYYDEANGKLHAVGYVQGDLGGQYFGSMDSVLLSRDEP